MNPLPSVACEAYDVLAPDYDEFTAHHDYELWMGGLLELAGSYGWSGRAALDAACGTGKSFLPLLEMGYDVTACDISAAMAARAREKAGRRAEVLVRDIRRLSRVGAFDLITCLDDVVNYLCSPQEVLLALQELAGNLAPGGLLVFDANTIHTYRTFFAETQVVETAHALMLWHGRESQAFGAGELAAATLDVFHQTEGLWSRRTSVHLQRHHPQALLEDLLRRAGLACIAVHGQFPDVTFEQPLDEERHTKGIYLACRVEDAERFERR